MAALKGTSESQDTSESEDASSTRTSNALAHPTGGTATSSPSCPRARVLRRRRPTAKSGGIVVSAVETASTVISSGRSVRLIHISQHHYILYLELLSFVVDKWKNLSSPWESM
jgi:hypothetical protein